MAERTWISGAVLISGLSAIIYVLATGEERLPKDRANGTYASPCCGVMVLQDGEMHVGNAIVPYSIEVDKVGAYVLPARFVGEGQGAFRLDGRVAPIKLRLDDVNRPTRVTLDSGHVATIIEM